MAGEHRLRNQLELALHPSPAVYWSCDLGKSLKPQKPLLLHLEKDTIIVPSSESCNGQFAKIPIQSDGVVCG